MEKNKIENDETKIKEAVPAAELEVNEDHSDQYVSLRNIDKVYDNKVQVVFDFNLDVKQKEFIVLVGPSGCGKTTTLRMIAGLEDITRGELWIDGVYSNDRTPKDRDIAMVFQSYALYPHMSVYDNMAFGLKIRRFPKNEIRARVHEAARILEIEEYLDRKPKQLSGGQRQRVALGRAIVRNAKVFLMDEPLSNLDAKLRVQMRSEIIKLHQSLGATTVYVTHDQTEAMTMATRIVVMRAGYIQQIGTPFEIYNHPANVFVAGFIGSPSMNFLRVHYSNGEIAFKTGERMKLAPQYVAAHDQYYQQIITEKDSKLKELNDLFDAALDADKDNLQSQIDILKKEREEIKELISGVHELVFGIRPEDVHEATTENIAKYEHLELFDIEVSVAELLGHEYYVHTDFGGIDLVSKVPTSKIITTKDHLKILFDMKKGHLFDLKSEKLIF
jgi:multiple sugar transport system ATP-binding protein